MADVSAALGNLERACAELESYLRLLGEYAACFRQALVRICISQGSTRP
jgi:hypothetical protein